MSRYLIIHSMDVFVFVPFAFAFAFAFALALIGDLRMRLRLRNNTHDAIKISNIKGESVFVEEWNKVLCSKPEEKVG